MEPTKCSCSSITQSAFEKSTSKHCISLKRSRSASDANVFFQSRDALLTPTEDVEDEGQGQRSKEEDIENDEGREVDYGRTHLV